MAVHCSEETERVDLSLTPFQVYYVVLVPAQFLESDEASKHHNLLLLT